MVIHDWLQFHWTMLLTEHFKMNFNKTYDIIEILIFEIHLTDKTHG